MAETPKIKPIPDNEAEIARQKSWSDRPKNQYVVKPKVLINSEFGSLLPESTHLGDWRYVHGRSYQVVDIPHPDIPGELVQSTVVAFIDTDGKEVQVGFGNFGGDSWLVKGDGDVAERALLNAHLDLEPLFRYSLRDIRYWSDDNREQFRQRFSDCVDSLTGHTEAPEASSRSGTQESPAFRAFIPRVRMSFLIGKI